MAYVTTGTVAARSDRFSTLISGLRAALARRRIYTQTVEELRRLSDRDLADLGFSRAEITTVARKAAYGK